jgi:uncharacterized protein
MLKLSKHFVESSAWPSPAKVLHASRLRSRVERLKYAARLWWSRHYLLGFTNTLTRLPEIERLYQSKPYFYYAPLSHFLDRRWGVAQRFKQMETDLHIAQQHFGTHICHELANQNPVTLFSIGNLLTVALASNPINNKEGHWALMISDAQGQRIFNMSFGFLDEHTVLIASIQGGSDGLTTIKDTIYALTKQCYGLRPQQLLFNTLQQLCASLDITRLLGIAPVNHVKGRWNKRKKLLRFDYMDFWDEMGSNSQLNGHALLPLMPDNKPIDAVPSHKRSQYKKRYALLEQMQMQVAQSLLSLSSQVTHTP